MSDWLRHIVRGILEYEAAIRGAARITKESSPEEETFQAHIESMALGWAHEHGISQRKAVEIVVRKIKQHLSCGASVEDAIAQTHHYVRREIEKHRQQRALNLIRAERTRQDAKWGRQRHSPERWATILMEEVGEYCLAVNEAIFNNGPTAREKGGRENMLRELSHVAAVAVAAMEALLEEGAEV